MSQMLQISPDNRPALFAALAKAQAEIKHANRDGINPHFKSKYATFSSIWDACREPLTKNGLAILQPPHSETAGVISVTTILVHAEGGYISSTLTFAPERATPQGTGSAITYAKRYGLASMVGVSADEDDDGNAASTKPQVQVYSEQNTPERYVGSDSQKSKLREIMKELNITDRDEMVEAHRKSIGREMSEIKGFLRGEIAANSAQPGMQ